MKSKIINLLIATVFTSCSSYFQNDTIVLKKGKISNFSSDSYTGFGHGDGAIHIQTSTSTEMYKFSNNTSIIEGNGCKHRFNYYFDKEGNYVHDECTNLHTNDTIVYFLVNEDPSTSINMGRISRIDSNYVYVNTSTKTYRFKNNRDTTIKEGQSYIIFE